MLKPFWLKWSLGFDIPLERTTLRGVDEHAPIAGYEHVGPAKERDAIWHFFYKVRGKGSEPTFKAKQLQLAVVVDEDDYNHAEEMKNRINDVGVSEAITKVSKNRSSPHVSRLIITSIRPPKGIRQPTLSQL